jgi:hypothetical protein
MGHKTVYRIFFTSQGKAYEIYAREVGQAELYGFIAIEGLLFGEKSALLLDPAEEGLKNEFQGVNRLLIPFHNIGRIDEVEKEGRGQVVALTSTGEVRSGSPFPPMPNDQPKP